MSTIEPSSSHYEQISGGECLVYAVQYRYKSVHANHFTAATGRGHTLHTKAADGMLMTSIKESA